MLVISLQQDGQSARIGPVYYKDAAGALQETTITVSLLRVRALDRQVRLGIAAPREIDIARVQPDGRRLEKKMQTVNHEATKDTKNARSEV